MKRIRRNGSVDSELTGCDLVRELVVADSGEALDTADHREVEEHLRECIECFQYRHHLRRIEAAVNLTTAPPLLPDPAIEGRLKSAVRARAESDRSGARGEVATWRAAFAVAAVVALLLVRGGLGPLQHGSAVATPGLTAVLLHDSKPESTRTDALTMTYRLQRPPQYEPPAEAAAEPPAAELFPASSTSAGRL